MAYSSITKPEDHFNTILYTGDGTSPKSITGVGFQPDWVWVKKRSGTTPHVLYDVVRGDGKQLISDASDSEDTNNQYGYVSDFLTDGYQVTQGSTNISRVNASSATFAAWNWLAAGTTPSKTYTVKVVSDSGNKYRFDDFGTSAVTLELSEGGTFRFDQSDSSNSGHPLRFSTTSDGSHGGGSEYTTGVTTSGTPGSSGAYTEITVAASAPTLYYYCTQHSGMGGQANTPTTNSFSNFSGSIQSNISPNTTAGFSIVSYTGTGSAATVGHGLSSTPELIITKRRSSSQQWFTYTTTTGSGKAIFLDSTSAESNQASAYNSNPTSTVINYGTDVAVNGSSDTYIAYCFHSVKGYSKIGSYTGNGNADGAFIYTGFKPAFIIVKMTSSTGSWGMVDNKRPGFNVTPNRLFADQSSAELTSSGNQMDLLSNGFKLRSSGATYNSSSGTYIYMAFAENPFVGNDSGTAVPVVAR